MLYIFFLFLVWVIGCCYHSYTIFLHSNIFLYIMLNMRLTCQNIFLTFLLYGYIQCDVIFEDTQWGWLLTWQQDLPNSVMLTVTIATWLTFNSGVLILKKTYCLALNFCDYKFTQILQSYLYWHILNCYHDNNLHNSFSWLPTFS